MKKILSILMAASMLTAAVPAMATTEGIVEGDILLISDAIEEDIDTPADNTEDAETPAVDEETPSEGENAPAVDEEATEDVAVIDYFDYNATVKEVKEGEIVATIEGAEYAFVTTENTLLLTSEGEEATEVKAGDSVAIISKSALLTKDIKEAVAVITADAESMISHKASRFDLVGETLLSADGELVIHTEDDASFAGKSLLVFYDIVLQSLPAQTAPIKIYELEAEEPVRIEFNVGDSKLNINGEMVEVEKPYIVGAGVTLVPIRVISEAFGAEVNWDGETKTVTVKLGDTEIIVTVDSKVATVNGEEMELEEAPELTENGFTMIPLRFISEKLGAEVGYIHQTQTITVEKN